MKPLLGDSEQDGNLLLGGLGSAKIGGASRVGAGGAFFKRAASRVSVLSSSGGSGSVRRYDPRDGGGRGFEKEK